MYFVCVILFCYVIATLSATGLNSRSVNLNLETVLQFDPQDNSADVHFIDNIQKFLGKVKTVIDSKSGRRSHRRQETPIKFTNFIKKAIEILKRYSDEDLEDVINAIDNEVRKFHYKGCKFHELIQNGDLRRFVASKLNAVQDQEGKDIKNSLNKILDALGDAEVDYKQAELLDYINSLYRQDDVGKMKTFLNELQAYRVNSKRANLDLLRIIRNGLRGIIFDHYSNLNPNARRELRIKIESFWDRSTDVTSTTEATTKKKFDFANSFNFLRDFTFEFITPDSFTTKTMETTTTGTTKYTAKPKPRKRNKHIVKAKTNKSPEEMSNYTENEKSKNESIEKPKKKNHKHKKNKEHKRKKNTHSKKEHVTDDTTLAPKHKHKSKKHKSEKVFRQHEVPSNVFDYKAIINVQAETDVSYSNERWKPDENVSVARSKKPKHKKRDFRKKISTDSEEGLSIDFKPSPISHSHVKRTTKQEDNLLRRLNNLERVVKTFESKINSNEYSEEENEKTSITTKKSKKVKATKTNIPPTTEKRTPAEDLSLDNVVTTPLWQKLSKKVQNIESVTKIRKPVSLSFIEGSIDPMPFENTESQKVQNLEIDPAWQKPVQRSQKIETVPTLENTSEKVQNTKTTSSLQKVSDKIVKLETMSTKHQQPDKSTTKDKIVSKLTTRNNSTTTPKVITTQRQNTYNSTKDNNSKVNPTGFTIKEKHFSTAKNDIKTNENHSTTKHNNLTTNQSDFKDAYKRADEKSQDKLLPDLEDNVIIPNIQNKL